MLEPTCDLLPAWLAAAPQAPEPAAKAGAFGRPGGLQAPWPPEVRYHTLAALVAVAGLPDLARCPSHVGHGCTVPPARPAPPQQGARQGGCGARWTAGLLCTPAAGWLYADGGGIVWVGWRGDATAWLPPDARCSPLPLASRGALPLPPALPDLALLYGALHAAHIPLMPVLGRLPARGPRYRTVAPSTLPAPIPAFPDCGSNVAVLRSQLWW